MGQAETPEVSGPRWRRPPLPGRPVGLAEGCIQRAWGDRDGDDGAGSGLFGRSGQGGDDAPDLGVAELGVSLPQRPLGHTPGPVGDLLDAELSGEGVLA